jgi:hypothetical protein
MGPPYGLKPGRAGANPPSAASFDLPEDPPMPKFLTPSLLALALGFSAMGDLAAATAAERDQHAIALAKLMDANLRLPAKRQFDEYQAAGYPADDAYLDKALRCKWLDRFIAQLPEKDKAKNEIELKALRTELDAALKANKLSGVTKLIYSGGGGSTMRMVNEIAKIMHPDLPKPLAPLVQEKRQALARLLDALGKQAEEDFKEAMAKVKAHKKDEDEMWNFPENDPRTNKIVNEACDLRIDAMYPLQLAHIALRDAIHRGKDFGIDPAPVAAQMKKLLVDPRPENENKPFDVMLTAWDFEWGESNPFVKLYSAILLSEAQKLGSKNVKDEDIDGALTTVVGFDTKSVKDPGARIEAYRFKLTALNNLLRWRLEQNQPKLIKRGLGAWNEFLETSKGDANLKLASAPPRLAGELGKLYIVAARLFKASGDNAAYSTLLAEVVGARGNPMGDYAKRWLASGDDNGQSSGTTAWGEAPRASDPAGAILVGKALIAESSSTADPAQSRAYLIKAAVALRNGVLGLGTVDEKVYLETAPEVYRVYSFALSKLDMRYHAVIAAQEGTRALIEHIKQYEQLKKPNPWKKPGADGKPVWDDTHISPLRLAFEGFQHVSALNSRSKNASPLYSDAIELLKTIDITAVGKTLEWNQLASLFQEGDYENCIAEAKKYMGKYPEDDLKTFSLITSARAQFFDKLAKDDKKDRLAALKSDIERDNAAMRERIEAELKKPDVSEERKKECMKALGAIQSSLIGGMIADKKYVEVLDALGPDFWKNPPADDTLSARMIKLLGRAAGEHYSSTIAESKDAATILAAYKRYDLAYRGIARMLPRLRKAGVDADLKNGSLHMTKVFSGLANQVVRLGAAATPDLIAIVDPANRAFADLYEPWVDDRTPSPNIIFLARTLWDAGEKKRAADQFIRYKASLAADAELQAFKKDPKPIIDKYGEPIVARTEYKKAWEEIADLSWDTPEFKQAYATLPKANWPAGLKADYYKALSKLREFRAKSVTPQRAVLDAALFKSINSSLDGLERLLTACASDLTVNSRLAQFYRENNEYAKAQELLNLLNDFDPLNPDYAIAVVLVTYRNALEGKASKDDMKRARDIAIDVRNAKQGTTDKEGYWDADCLVYEFSVLMGDMKVVVDRLSFLRRNKSDLSRDMVAPPVWGDDKRARRPSNAQAADTARRYLVLHEKAGEKPSFRIDEVESGADKLVIFTDPDAPKFELRAMKTPDDDDVTALVASDGSTPPPQALPPVVVDPPPAAKPAPGAAPAATPGATPAAAPGAAATPAATPTAAPAPATK